jgi:hypothetical protein
MSRRPEARQGPASGLAVRRAARRCAGLLGVLGSAACSASMILTVVGVGGAAAATGMAAMTGGGPGAPGGAPGALVRAGPWLTPPSVLLVTAAALTRRPLTAVLAFLAGAVLDAGMYAQHNLAVMYASIAVGYLTWAALALRASPSRHKALPGATPQAVGGPPAGKKRPDTRE